VGAAVKGERKGRQEKGRTTNKRKPTMNQAEYCIVLAGGMFPAELKLVSGGLVSSTARREGRGDERECRATHKIGRLTYLTHELG
jgi:hypothetical protein